MSGLSPFENIYLHFRIGSSSVRGRNVEDALNLAAARMGDHPYRITSGNDELLLHEDDLREELGL